MNICFDVAGERVQFFVGSDLLFGAFAVAKDALCGFLIAPEVGIGYARFE